MSNQKINCISVLRIQFCTIWVPTLMYCKLRFFWHKPLADGFRVIFRSFWKKNLNTLEGVYSFTEIGFCVLLFQGITFIFSVLVSFEQNDLFKNDDLNLLLFDLFYTRKTVYTYSWWSKFNSYFLSQEVLQKVMAMELQQVSVICNLRNVYHT